MPIWCHDAGCDSAAELFYDLTTLSNTKLEAKGLHMGNTFGALLDINNAIKVSLYCTSYFVNESSVNFLL